MEGNYPLPAIPLRVFILPKEITIARYFPELDVHDERLYEMVKTFRRRN